MKTNKREEQILELLKERRFVSVADLSEILYTSPSSIRRDLNKLQTRGLVLRNYGGVMLSETPTNAAPVQHRKEAQKAEKKYIAKEASSLLRDHSTVFLDSSTTASYLTEYIAQKTGITVITNNLQTAEGLIENGVDTYLLGGHALSCSAVVCGSYAEDMVRMFHADIVFFSSFALSDKGVISDCTAEENSMRKYMLAQSDCRVFLCDSSKFNRTATHRLCTVKDIEHCIYYTDPCLSEDLS